MEFLKEILGEELYNQFAEKINAYNGIEENKEKQIKIGNLGSGDYVSKLKYDDLDALLRGKTTELDTANKLIEDLKKSNKGDTELQGKVTAYETQVKQLQEQLQEEKISNAIKVALLSANASDLDYMTFKLKEKGETFELDENGNVKGIEGIIDGLKKQFPTQFTTGSGAGFGNIEPKPIPAGEHNSSEPSSLAEALEMQFNK